MSDSPNAASTTPDGLQSAGFNELRLQPGSRVQLVLAGQGGEHAHFTTVVGFLRGEYLILKLPQRKQGPIAIAAGDSLRVRLFSGIHLYEFRCGVLRVFEPPVDYMHVSFPDDIRVTPVRMAPRVRAELPAQLVLPDGSRHEGLLADISSRGAQLQLVADGPVVEDGARVRVAFSLRAGVDEREHAVEAECVARTLKPLRPADAGERLQAYGLQFGELDAASSLALQNFILRRMIEDQDSVV
jgi:c-di-GMP-binding flagellar brake protein YcgR